MTTKEIIQYLPFQLEFKQELLANFEKLDTDTMLSVGEMLWDLYYELYESRLRTKVQIAMDKVAKGQIELNESFYLDIHKEVEQEMKQEVSTTTNTAELDSVRQKLQSLMQN